MNILLIYLAIAIGFMLVLYPFFDREHYSTDWDTIILMGILWPVLLVILIASVVAILVTPLIEFIVDRIFGGSNVR